MGELLKAIKDAARPKSKGLKITAILAQLSPSEKRDLEEAAKDPTVSNRAIAEVLTARGHPITQNPIGAWRETVT
jgi:hypothetical protein